MHQLEGGRVRALCCNSSLHHRVRTIFGLKRAEALIELFQAADNHDILTAATSAELQCKIMSFLGFPGIKGCISISDQVGMHSRLKITDTFCRGRKRS